MDTREAADLLARHWQAGWARHEVDGIASLYADDCVHRSMPFRPEHLGRDRLIDYILGSFAEERTASVRFGKPIVDGDRAAVEYLAAVVETRGERPMTLAGCAFVRFGSGGLVVESHDYWHTAEGHRLPTGPLFV